MAIKVQTEFLNATTIRIVSYVYDTADALADATGLTIDIYDPDGTQQATAQAMTNQSTGIYDYYYHKGAGEAAMDSGRWRGKVLVVDGAGGSAIYSEGTFSFKVI